MKALASIIGAVVGAVAVSGVNTLLHLVFAGQLFSDGLYVIFYFFFVPQGVWLGGLTGYGLAAAGRGRHQQVGITLLVGCVLLVFVALLFACSYPSDRWGCLTAYFGVALVWALGLIVWAIRLVKSSLSSA